MSFMQREITEKMKWYCVDGDAGITYVPADLVGKGTNIRDYTESSRVFEVNMVEGYGARLSAPGYLDCTEWTVHPTPEDAEEYLEEVYGDDDGDDEEE